MPFEGLEELPMSKQELPRFDKVYTPRGRRALCNEQQRTDLICNDTLKRIEKALEADGDNSSEKLKQLAKRQLERFNGFPPNNRRAEDKQKWRYWGKEPANVYQSVEKCEKSHSEVKNLQIPNRPRNRRRSLGKLESVDRLTRQQQPHSQRQLRQQQIPLNCGVIQPFEAEPEIQSTAGAAQADTKTLSYYLQYAADYYKQGFLSNVEYLESVGERNQLRRKKLPHTSHKATRSPPRNCINQSDNFTPIESSSRSIQRQSSFVHDSTGDQTTNSCNSILTNIARNHSFRIYRYKEKETEYPEFSDNSAHWPIRVQIKPADSGAASQSNANGNGNGSVLSKGSQQKWDTTTTQDCYSMNDYLNGNLEFQQHQAPSYYNNRLINFCHEYPNKDPEQLLDFDSLISNLEDLEIVQTNLPRITLTDYTHRQPTDFPPFEATATATTTNSILSGKQQQSLNSVLLRQPSIELSAPANLDIPLEATNYHIEARPPQSNLPI